MIKVNLASIHKFGSSFCLYLLQNTSISSSLCQTRFLCSSRLATIFHHISIIYWYISLVYFHSIFHSRTYFFSFKRRQSLPKHEWPTNCRFIGAGLQDAQTTTCGPWVVSQEISFYVTQGRVKESRNIIKNPQNHSSYIRSCKSRVLFYFLGQHTILHQG